MKDIELRLRNMADKWHDANREVFEVCRDAAEEIRVLRIQRNCAIETKEATIIAYNHGTGWGKGKDE
jgi:hypothetical protein